MTLFEIFHQALSRHSISDEKIKEFFHDFSAVAVLAIFKEAEGKINDDQKKALKSDVEQKQFEKAATTLKSCFSDDEWQSVIDNTIAPLLQNYIADVIG